MTKQQVIAKIKEKIDSLVKEYGQCERPEGNDNNQKTYKK